MVNVNRPCARSPLERTGPSSPVPRVARGGQGGLVEVGGLIPMTVGAKEVAHRRGDDDGMAGQAVDGGIISCGVQVRPFGVQPSRCLLGVDTTGTEVGGLHGESRSLKVVQAGMRWPAARRCAGNSQAVGWLRRWSQLGRRPRQGRGRVGGAGRVAGSGRGGLDEQVLVVQLIKMLRGLVQSGVGQGGGGTGVEAGAREQPKAAE